MSPKGSTNKEYGYYLICIAPGTYHGLKFIVQDVNGGVDTVITTKTHTFYRNQKTYIGDLSELGKTASVSVTTGFAEESSFYANISEFLTTSLSVKRVCTTAGGGYAVGDIVNPTKETKETEFEISRDNLTYVLWAGVGINRNTSSGKVTSLGFNAYKTGFSRDSAEWTCGEEAGGYAWVKFPAVEGYRLTKVSCKAKAGSESSLNLYSGVNANGSGTGAMSTESTVTTATTTRTFELDGTAGTPYYLGFGKAPNIALYTFTLTYTKVNE